jgi:hypothetical protein
MNKSPLNISGPYTHQNLTIFLFHDPDHVDSSHYVQLHDAMEKKHVVVYETGNVGELGVENLSDVFDIFIQAGDVLKGGRQDRTIAIDFIVPAKSGRIPIPAFCVESGRWQRRKSESERFFSCSSHALHAKPIRLAAKLKRSQSAVWEEVAACQEDLGSALESLCIPTLRQRVINSASKTPNFNVVRSSLGSILATSPMVPAIWDMLSM